MSNFIIRLLTSLILGPLFIYVLYINNISLYFLLIIILLISIFELNFLFKKNFPFYCFMVAIIILFIASILDIRGNDIASFYHLLWLVLLVWLSDIGGYVTGKIFGGKKLSKLSPNKTYSGLIGSIIFSQLSIFIINIFHFTSSFTPIVMLIQLKFCLIAVTGDLFFSFIKRQYLIKDYSSIIPGHGGILDRIDGLIFVLIFFYIINNFYAF